MKDRYTLIEAARKLELNQRAEVKDVLKQILNPDEGNPLLTVSVYFPEPKRLIARGKNENWGDIKRFREGEETFTELPGLFDILRLPHTPMGQILAGRYADVRNCMWPDEDGLYPLNLRTSKRLELYIYLVQSGIVYELQDKITCRETDLVISRENLENYAAERGIHLRRDDIGLSQSVASLHTDEEHKRFIEIAEHLETTLDFLFNSTKLDAKHPLFPSIHIDKNEPVKVKRIVDKKPAIECVYEDVHGFCLIGPLEWEEDDTAIVEIISQQGLDYIPVEPFRIRRSDLLISKTAFEYYQERRGDRRVWPEAEDSTPPGGAEPSQGVEEIKGGKKPRVKLVPGPGRMQVDFTRVIESLYFQLLGEGKIEYMKARYYKEFLEILDVRAKADDIDNEWKLHENYQTKENRKKGVSQSYYELIEYVKPGRKKDTVLMRAERYVKGEGYKKQAYTQADVKRHLYYLNKKYPEIFSSNN